MKVFISWSGKDTASFNVAKKLAEWLPMVLQETEPFMSDDIDAGTDFNKMIMKNLISSKVGIICVTKNNIKSPWLNFEAGALSNVVTSNKGIVIPLLIEMTTEDLSESSSPIKNFQAVEFGEDGVQKMINSVNKYTNRPLSDTQINSIYESLKSSLFNDTQTKNLTVNIIEEPLYIVFLRDIVHKYDRSGYRAVLYKKHDFNPNDADILVSMGYISITKYIDGSIAAKPTGEGIKYVMDNPSK